MSPQAVLGMLRAHNPTDIIWNDFAHLHKLL